MNYLALISGWSRKHNCNARGKFHELADAEEWAQSKAFQTNVPVQILRLPDKSFVKAIWPMKDKPEQVKQRRKSK